MNIGTVGRGVDTLRVELRPSQAPTHACLCQRPDTGAEAWVQLEPAQIIALVGLLLQAYEELTRAQSR